MKPAQAEPGSPLLQAALAGVEAHARHVATAPRAPLTRKQRNVLCAIILLQDLNDGIAPSYQALADELGLKSKGQVYVLVQRLAERGWVRTHRAKYNAIEVLHEPDVPDPEFVLADEPMPPHLVAELSAAASLYADGAAA